MASTSRQQFIDFMPRAIRLISKSLTEQQTKFRFLDGLLDSQIEPAVAHLQESLEYNLPGGKHARGLMAAEVFNQLSNDDRNGDSHFILGWAVECLQTSFLVADDIMDNSPTRRGRKCWYRNENVGLTAINDSLSLESCVYSLLRSLPDHLPIHDIVALFQEVTFLTEMGQTLDMQNSELPTVDLSRFTDTNYSAIVRYKTSCYSFYLPIAAGMIAAGKDANHPIMKKILLEMGYYFQVQDDFLDCYGDPEVTGKVGTDIQDNKCSWLVVKALSCCSESDRLILERHYGKKCDDDIIKIRELYNRLDMRQHFADFEDTSYTKINELIATYDGPLDRWMFDAIAKKLYKRKS